MTKHLSRVTKFCLSLYLVAAVGCQSPPAAEINGRTVSVDELDAYIKEELFNQKTGNKSATKLYELRASTVHRMIDQRVLQDAADADDASPEDYLANEVSARGGITDAEVEAFFNEHSDELGGATLEEISPRIRDHLKQQKTVEIVVGLRQQAGAVILLEPARVEVEAVGPSQGPDDAPIVIVEFSDFQCPFCQRVLPTISGIRERYPDQVRIVYRHLPLDSIHSRARAASEASACADQQGKFWEYHDLIFENNRSLADEDLEAHASTLGLEMEAFRQCVSERQTQQIVQNDSAAAGRLGLTGTPAFYVNGIPLSGAKPLGEFVRVIDAELARRGVAAAE